MRGNPHHDRAGRFTAANTGNWTRVTMGGGGPGRPGPQNAYMLDYLHSPESAIRAKVSAIHNGRPTLHPRFAPSSAARAAGLGRHAMFKAGGRK